MKLQHRLEEGLRLLSRSKRSFHTLWRRVTRKPRTVTEAPNLLPTLIKVLAAFTRTDGEMLEEEIDSILGFLRYDYPEAVYSGLRQLFRHALEEKQDLSAMAAKLAVDLNNDRKILLGVQLYDLIAHSGMKAEQLTIYHDFFSKLGMSEQAIEIVRQLNANEESSTPPSLDASSQLEILSFGDAQHCDVALRNFPQNEFLLAYRYHDFIILKNKSLRSLMVQGRLLKPQEFCRIYPGQRILAEEQVITSQDLSFYFNAKKNVTLPHIFVAIDKNEVRLNKTRSRDSSLEVAFGLKVTVKVLQDLQATINGIRLNKGTALQAQLDDRILFSNGGELNLNDLRRRVRSLGGRFPLKASKSEYLVSNNPGLLEENDILLSHGSGGEVLLKITCNYEERTGTVEVLQADRPIIVHDLPVRNSAPLVNGDTIGINPEQLLRCNFVDRIIEEERNIIHNLDMRDVICRFPNGDIALDNLTFSVERGEMICVMGASGCGKSTLLRTLSGEFKPVQGEVLLNNHSLYANYEALRQYTAYIPQYEAFDEQLTIEENIFFAAALRAPHLSRQERLRRIDSKLAELGLNERRKNVVGATHQKVLSGGERKRLNIGLDMIGTADVYLFDEPTSGLSSKDSEHVIDIIRGIAHNKIVLVTIHQPTSKIFQMFQKALLLDRGGKCVFFGTPSEMLAYFAEAEHEQLFGTELGGCQACGATRPEFVFDVLETPLRDLSGDLIYQENNRGQLVPARRFSPDYWRDKFETHRLIKDVQQSVGARSTLTPTMEAPQPPLPIIQQDYRWREEVSQFLVLLQRSFISKLRNRANLLTTLVEAPLLAFLIGIVLHYSESSTYDFASAFHIPTYLFLSLVVAMFLGLTNSVDDIIRDRPVLLRERNLNVRLAYYLLAKAITLGLFAIAQCILFTWIGNRVLSIRGFFTIEFLSLFLTAFSGISLGLLISALVAEGKTAVNIIPVVLIPQIILGGALIKYEEMNRNLDFIYSIQQWFHHHPDSAIEPRSDLQVPLICEFMPMRWSYEALVYAQAKLNPLSIRQARIQGQINQIAAIKNPSERELNRLDDLKEALAILSGLEAPTTDDLEHRLALIDRVINGATLDRASIVSPVGGSVTAEQLYTNQKIIDLVSKAEMEQADYRDMRHPNVFFGPVKYYWGITFNILTFNIGVLLLSTGGIFWILYLILRRQIKIRQD
ncbi:MAG: ATP-binding cassette domain-containing protein [Verrucomicrobiae bacterium]|nr:ATP-binding cassette domain-containing protein [Verrucomicrobiae bacterium]